MRAFNIRSLASARLKEFPPFALDDSNQCLWRSCEGKDPERILMKPKAFDILRHLVHHAGRLVSQDELLDAVWPDTHVQPDVLKRHVFDIRNVLGDHPKTPVFIETHSRRGYQFIAPVNDGSSATSAGADYAAQTNLVGRDSALNELRARLTKALRGERQLVFVTGETGIGKTSIVDEFQRQVAAGTPVRMVRGQCVEGYGGKEAYYPILEAVGSLCRGAEGSSVIPILAAQAPTLLAQFPALLEPQLRERLQREILGDTRQRMLREIAGALETIAAEVQLLLVLEDLHWADPSTVDLLSALARGRSAVNLMVIGTYRAADLAFREHPLRMVEQDLMVHRLCHEIALEPLDEKEIAAYLAGEPVADARSNDLATVLYRHSEGNPLFMIETLEHLSVRGVVSRESGKWRLRVPVEEIELQVPENLRQLIELQIDRLSAEERRALEAASAVGDPFSAVVCAAAAAMEVEECEDLLNGLSRRSYMARSGDRQRFPNGAVSESYKFVHALYREVLYRRQCADRRAKLHLAIEDRLETLRRTTDRSPVEFPQSVRLNRGRKSHHVALAAAQAS